MDGAPRDGPRLRPPLPERRLLRWREEAERDPPARDARAGDGRARRDGLRPGHRRAAHRRRRYRARARGAAPPRRAAHHPLPADPCRAAPGSGARDDRRPDRRVGRSRAGRTARRGGVRVVAVTAAPSPTDAVLDAAALRADFPLLAPTPGKRRVVYLDSASSSQRPFSVLEAMNCYYSTTHANVHRGVYAIAEEATRRCEHARQTIGRLVGAPQPATEVVFTKNATEAINLVAGSWGRKNLQEGDAILLTEMEHHANLVPWLMLAEERGLQLRYLPVGEDFRFDLTDLDRLASGVKLVGVS